MIVIYLIACKIGVLDLCFVTFPVFFNNSLTISLQYTLTFTLKLRQVVLVFGHFGPHYSFLCFGFHSCDFFLLTYGEQRILFR